MPIRILALALSLVAMSQPAYALRFYVNPTTGDDRRSVRSAQDSSTAFKTITQALRIAHLIPEKRPHVIELTPGTYAPSMGESFPLQISQSGIYIQVSGQTVFDGEGKSNFFHITAPTSEFTIKDIEFRNGLGEKGGVAYCNTCTLRVTNNRFFDNRSTQGGHLIYSENGQLKFFNNLVRNNGGESDTLAVIDLRHTSADTSVRNEIRNNTFYRNPSTNIRTSNPQTYISSNIFVAPDREAIRDASDSATPFIGHNLFWQTEVLYVSDQRDSVQLQRADRDTMAFSSSLISLPSFMRNAPDIRALSFRSDTLSLGDLNMRLPSFVTNAPDTLVIAGQAHQYLIGLTGPVYQYGQFVIEPLDIPTGAEILSVDAAPRFIIWQPTLDDTARHTIRFKMTDPFGAVDTLSYDLNVITAQDFPDTTSFRALSDSNGRFAGMYREVNTIEVPHEANQLYEFDIEVQGDKSQYEFTALELPTGATMSDGIIDWYPTTADTGRSRISVEIIDPSSNVDTLKHDVFVFLPGTFPDTSTTARLITATITLDTTGALSSLNALTPSFSSAASAVGNLYADPAFLDTTVNRFELLGGVSPGIDAGTPVSALNDQFRNNANPTVPNENRNDIGYLGGPFNSGPPAPDITSFEVAITSLPDSVVMEGETFVYDPTISPNTSISIIDLITDVPGSSLPPTMGPYSPFATVPPIQWTPTIADTGSYLIGVTVYTSGNSGRHYFPLRVRPLNERPYLTVDADTTALEDEPYAYSIQANDVNGDTLTYSLVTGPEGLSVDSTTGLVTWLPTQDDLGDTTVTVDIDDGKGGVFTHSFTLSVSNTNDAPTISSSPDTSAVEDALFTYTVIANDPDLLDTLTYALSDSPTGARIDSAGILTWTPTQNQVGAQLFTVTATDLSNASAIQEFSVQVSPFDDPPVIAAAPDTSAIEDDAYQLDLLASDEEGGPLQYTLATAPQGMTVDSTGVLNWLPTATDVGIHVVEVTVSDPSGQSVSLSFTINVQAVNDAPQIVAQTPDAQQVLNVYRDAVTFLISASDEENDTLSFSWLVNGVLQAGEQDSTFFFAPSSASIDTITVQISDANAATEYAWQLDSRSIPRLSLDRTRGKFGNIAIDDSASTEIDLINTGESTLLISELQVVDLDFAASFGSRSVEPGESTTLFLRYAPDGRGASVDTIRFTTNDPDNTTVSIPVSGTGVVATKLSLDLDRSAGNQEITTQSARGGESLYVALYAEQAALLQRYDIELAFDPDVLQFARFNSSYAEESNLLNSEGASATHLAQLNSASILAITGALPASGVTGDGLLGHVTFVIDPTVGSGPTTVAVQQAILQILNESLHDTLGSFPAATVDLQPALLGDFNADGTVDFDDFFIFADSFGQNDFNPATDLNRDGAVTFDDFFIFGDNFGATVAGKRPVKGEFATGNRLDLEPIRTAPDELVLAPFWHGRQALRGYVIELSFDPSVLQFSRYAGRDEEAPLHWVVDSRSGQLTIAAGLASSQRAFSGSDLGQLTFVRLSGQKTEISTNGALVYADDQMHVPAFVPALSVSSLPETFVLYPAHPNPFNPETSIPFYTPEQASVSVRIYDLLGRSVRTLLAKRVSAGYHNVVWNGTDNDGRPVGSGVYLVQMQSSSWRQVQKIMLLK